jgi:hypothetical protein
MPVASLQPARYTFLSVCLASVSANVTLTLLGLASTNNGYRPYGQYLVLERIVAHYNVTTTNGADWTLEVYNRGALVVDEDFTRTGTGWKSVERTIDVSMASNFDAAPGYITTKLVNPAGTTLTGVNILVEGYLVDV